MLRTAQISRRALGWLAAGMMVFMVVVAAKPSLADDRDFVIVNSTGYPIKGVFVNPPGDENFNDNELSSVLADGGNHKVKFTGADKGCTWNMKVTWADDNSSSMFRNMDLCKISTVTLKYNRSTDTASYTWE